MREYPNSLHSLRSEKDLTLAEVAEAVGTDASTISKLEKGKTKLNDSWLRRLSEVLQATADEILMVPATKSAPARASRSTAEPARRATGAGDGFSGTGLIPLYGFAAGSLTGEVQVMTDVIDRVPAPPALLHVRDAYVMLTRNESMVPRYMPNEPLYVNPHQVVRPGDHVIIQVQTQDNGPIETWVKRYDTESADEVFVSQYNPPSRLIYKKKFVKAVHRILPPGELF